MGVGSVVATVITTNKIRPCIIVLTKDRRLQNRPRLKPNIIIEVTVISRSKAANYAVTPTILLNFPGKVNIFTHWLALPNRNRPTIVPVVDARGGR